MTITLRKAIAGLAAAGSLTLAGAAPALAGAGPGNAPSSFTGRFFDCSNNAKGAIGTYVINVGNSHAQQTWDAANLTFDLGSALNPGGTGVFIQTSSDLSTDGGKTYTTVMKGSAPGSVTCSIFGSQGEFTVQGTVTGNIVTNG